MSCVHAPQLAVAWSLHRQDISELLSTGALWQDFRARFPGMQCLRSQERTNFRRRAAQCRTHHFLCLQLLTASWCTAFETRLERLMGVECSEAPRNDVAHILCLHEHWASVLSQIFYEPLCLRSGCVLLRFIAWGVIATSIHMPFPSQSRLPWRARDERAHGRITICLSHFHRAGLHQIMIPSAHLSSALRQLTLPVQNTGAQHIAEFVCDERSQVAL